MRMQSYDYNAQDRAASKNEAHHAPAGVSTGMSHEFLHSSKTTGIDTMYIIYNIMSIIFNMEIADVLSRKKRLDFTGLPGGDLRPVLRRYGAWAHRRSRCADADPVLRLHRNFRRVADRSSCCRCRNNTEGRKGCAR